MTKAPSTILPRKKPLLPYYGGKQAMLPHILPLIPPHTVYVEPFCGGAAVFWAKQPAELECINDVNGELVNFYRVAQQAPDRLAKLINATLHSRLSHWYANVVYNNPALFSRTRRAWAVWTGAIQGYCHQLDGTWGYEKTPSNGKSRLTGYVAKRAAEFSTADEFGFNAFSTRLQKTQIECVDALRLIEARDEPGVFFYLDPPYFNSDCGHYRGYSEADFASLLAALSTLKGRFLLSCYDSDVMRTHANANGWTVDVFDKQLSASPPHARAGRRKIKCLVRNY